MDALEALQSASIWNNTQQIKNKTVSQMALQEICEAILFDLRPIESRYADTKNFQTLTLPSDATLLDI